jgi:hypothetical protein
MKLKGKCQRESPRFRRGQHIRKAVAQKEEQGRKFRRSFEETQKDGKALF